MTWNIRNNFIWTARQVRSIRYCFASRTWNIEKLGHIVGSVRSEEDFSFARPAERKPTTQSSVAQKVREYLNQQELLEIHRYHLQRGWNLERILWIPSYFSSSLRLRYTWLHLYRSSSFFFFTLRLFVGKLETTRDKSSTLSLERTLDGSLTLVSFRSILTSSSQSFCCFSTRYLPRHATILRLGISGWRWDAYHVRETRFSHICDHIKQ